MLSFIDIYMRSSSCFLAAIQGYDKLSILDYKITTDNFTEHMETSALLGKLTELNDVLAERKKIIEQINNNISYAIMNLGDSAEILSSEVEKVENLKLFQDYVHLLVKFVKDTKIRIDLTLAKDSLQKLKTVFSAKVGVQYGFVTEMCDILLMYTKDVG